MHGVYGNTMCLSPWSIFQYSQVVQDTDSYKWLPWQQYLTNINFKYIAGDKIEIPTDTYQIHTSVINIKKYWGILGQFGSGGVTCKVSPKFNSEIYILDFMQNMLAY